MRHPVSRRRRMTGDGCPVPLLRSRHHRRGKLRTMLRAIIVGQTAKRHPPAPVRSSSCRRPRQGFKPDGGLKDMMARVTMLAMHRDSLHRADAAQVATGQAEAHRLRTAIPSRRCSQRPGEPLDGPPAGSTIRPDRAQHPRSAGSGASWLPATTSPGSHRSCSVPSRPATPSSDSNTVSATSPSLERSPSPPGRVCHSRDNCHRLWTPEKRRQ